MNQEQSIMKHDHIISNHQSIIKDCMNNQKHKVVLNNENTNLTNKKKDKGRSHHLIHSVLDQILCNFNLLLIPSNTYNSFSQCNTLWRMLGY